MDRARPPARYFTKRQAEDWLRDTLGVPRRTALAPDAKHMAAWDADRVLEGAGICPIVSDA
jgi:hypothetical protein